MMQRETTDLAFAVSDAEDRLISADEPLAGLQLRCGGELPGTIAIPALLEAVRKARRYRLKLARMIGGQDGSDAITAWVEISPRPDDKPGCEIVVRNWRTAPLPADDPTEAESRRHEIEAQVAELTARLDSDQRVLAVESDAPDLADLLKAMRAGTGRPWTDFVTLEGTGHHLPMHWRLLDGMRLQAPGSKRSWCATLIPYGSAGTEPTSFDLLFSTAEPPPQAPGEPPAKPDVPSRPYGLVGQEIAPVLRQPIARIIANAETIRTRLAGPLADSYAEYAADITTAGQLLLGLLDDLADLEVVESQNFSTAPDRIDLADVVRQAAGILSVRAAERNIEIVAPGAGESLYATAEFRRVLQILLNLIGNAIRYSPAGTTIRIELDVADERVIVAVADEGPGLSHEAQQIVFEKFERLGRGGDGGSGLGLYISRRLARAMNGDLTVDSSPGNGARFVLALPAGEEG